MSVSTFVQPSDLRAFAGNFATGVAVVTTRNAKGACFGLTMNAVTSLSLNPPLLLICLANGSSTLGALHESGRFCLHFLASNQQDLSGLFSKKIEEKFTGLSYRIGELGSPVLAGVVAASECDVLNKYPGGDHTIIVGAVKTVSVTGGEPLLYHRGEYASLVERREIA
jgi:flavin reductase (DIM6/NTAB) family NADH-FMN oxidoreductase RutF